jgi:uncharacterized protein (DUF885 family)
MKVARICIYPCSSVVKLLCFCALGSLFCLQALCAETPFEQACSRLASQKGKDTERLHALFKLDWDYTMHESPEFATEVGYPGQNDRWSDSSLEAIERHKRELKAPNKVILSINRAKLNASDQLNYDLFRKNSENALEGTRFPGEYMPINQMDGVQQDLARVLELAPRELAEESRRRYSFASHSPRTCA